MRLARRIEKLPPYLFAEISRKVAEKRAQGVVSARRPTY